MTTFLARLWRALRGRRKFDPESRHPTSQLSTSALAAKASPQQQMVTAILELRRSSDAAEDPESIESAIGVFRVQAAGVLVDHEFKSEIAKAERTLTSLRGLLETRRCLQEGQPLPIVGVLSDGDANLFHASSVSLERPRGDDDSGTLDISAKAMFFEGEKRLTLPWRSVLTLSLKGKNLTVHRTTAGAPHAFGMSSLAEAKLAHLIASELLKRHQQQESAPSAKKPKRTKPTLDESPAGSTIELPKSGSGFTVSAVGESHRQVALRAFGGTKRSAGEEVFFSAALVPEPTNRYDPNAIRVHIQAGAHVGYLSAEDAVEYRDVAKVLIEQKAIGLCRAKLIGGTPGKPSIGVVLDLADPATVLAAITPPDSQPF
jgi:hypothetical protein